MYFYRMKLLCLILYCGGTGFASWFNLDDPLAGLAVVAVVSLRVSPQSLGSSSLASSSVAP